MNLPPHTPPSAAVRPQPVESAHGTRLDDYYWLRDDERADPDVLGYLRAENAHTEDVLRAGKGLEEKLYTEIIGRLKQDDSSVPYFKNGYWYYTRFDTGQEHPIFARRRGTRDAPEEIVLNGNELAAGHEYWQIGSLDVSPDAQCVAFTEDTIGRRQYRLRFKNLQSGEVLRDTIPDVEADLAWANDNRTVLYIEKDAETLLGLDVKKHVLGQDPTLDALVFHQTDKSFYTGISKSKSDRFLFLSMESTVSSEWRYADADDPRLEFKVFRAHQRDHEYQIEHLGDAMIVRTNWRAANFRLMRAPLANTADRSQWQDLVPHRDDTFIEEFDVFNRFLALSVRSGGLSKISVLPLDGDGAAAGDEYFIGADEATYTTALSVNPDIDSPRLRYTYTSLTTPATVYEYDVTARVRSLLKRDPVIGEFSPDQYHSEFVSVPARDGRSIPVSLVYRHGFRRDGSAPLLQYAYGSYGLSMDPGFSSSRLSLLDRGFVYAIAHIRGGQELGRAWYDEGRLLNKKNSFNDFIDVTRWLVDNHYAAPDKVCAMGGSAGGLLMGAIVNLAPEAYRAIVAQVPFVDVLTTMLDESIPLTTNEYDEWGDPREQAFYDYLLSYSPYDNVRAQAYPSMLVTTGLWDSQVQYYEPAKWVAKLRTLKTDHNPLLLHTDMEAGHGGKSGRFQRYREIAMEYAFLLRQTGIDS